MPETKAESSGNLLQEFYYGTSAAASDRGPACQTDIQDC